MASPLLLGPGLHVYAWPHRRISSDYNYNAKAQALKQLTGDQRFDRYYQLQLYLQDRGRCFPVSPSITV